MTTNMVRIGAALAVSESGVIGINKADGTTAIPWSVPEDMIWFRGLCFGKRVLMGGRTYAECKDFLKFWNVQSIAVYTRAQVIGPEHLENYAFYLMSTQSNASIYAQLNILYDTGDDLIVVGGAETYRAFLPYTQWVSLTTIPDSAVTPLGEGESYVYAKDLVETFERDFGLKKILVKQTSQCSIRYGKRK